MEMLQTAFGPTLLHELSKNLAPVFEWHKRFVEGRASLRDDERCKEVRIPNLIGQIKNVMDKDRRVSIDNNYTVWCQCRNSTDNCLRGTDDAEDLREVCHKGALGRSERLAGGDYFEENESFMYVLSIKVPIRKMSGNLLKAPGIERVVRVIMIPFVGNKPGIQLLILYVGKY